VPAWLRWLPAAALVVAVIVFAVFFAVVAHGVWWGEPAADATALREQVLAAGKQCTVAANTYDYRTFAADERKGLACTTGQQLVNYRKAMTTLIKPKVDKLKASQSVAVTTAGIESVSPDGTQWTLLVFGQLTIRTTQTGAKGRVDPFAAKIIVQKAGGRWLLAKIDTVAGSET
jgi:hypothetical protein